MDQQQQGVPGKNGGRLSMAGMGRKRGVPNKASRTIKAAYMQALDKAGGWKVFYRLATGSAEDRRCFATIGARLFPIEVHGQMDQTLTVIVSNLSHLHTSQEHLPLQGTCARVELPANAPIAAPIDGETVPNSEEGGAQG